MREFVRVSSNESKRSFPLLAIALMCLFQVRFPLRVTPMYFVCVLNVDDLSEYYPCEGEEVFSTRSSYVAFILVKTHISGLSPWF